MLIDNSKNYAITDFGISSRRGGSHGYYFDEENSGTLAYMAPERFQEGAEPIAQSDIWAFGATLCEILTGKVPFGEDGGSSQATQNMPMPSIPNVPGDIQRLIYACLSPEPGNRPSAEDIVKAATERQYPVKSKKWIYFAISILVVVLLSVIIYAVSKKAQVIEPVIDKSEMFENAMKNMDSSNADSLTLGIKQMDSLCTKDYIPALYELAFTYGWYSDSISLKRKQILGIDVFIDGEKIHMAKLDKYNEKAIALLQRIVDLKDSTQAGINGQATYRLAIYYGNNNNIYKQNIEKSKYYLESSLKWATMAKDTTLLSKVKLNISKLENSKGTK